MKQGQVYDERSLFVIRNNKNRSNYQYAINSQILQLIQKKYQNITSIQMFNIQNSCVQWSTKTIKPQRLPVILLISPKKSEIEKLKNFTNQEITSQIPYNIHTQNIQQDSKDSQDEREPQIQEYFQSQCKIEDLLNSNPVSEQRQRKRKNKEEKSKQIEQSHKDNGRGGNCIASNISKTLNRIIGSKVKKQVFDQFTKYTKNYKIKSQKQNTIILLLILYILARQRKIDVQTLDLIFDSFMKSLKDSQQNCEKKMSSEQSRRSFHLKNKKMYTRFIDINQRLFDNLKNSLMKGNSSSPISLSQIQNIISDTYDRKQRQVEKAMNKLKSIIMNHIELKELFGYWENSIEQIFQEAIDYAYRRNLPKRCKQVKSKAQKVFQEFNKNFFSFEEQNKYMVCYMVLKLIDEKQKQIWYEFIQNLCMKKQFNLTTSQIKELQNRLQKEIPQQFEQNKNHYKENVEVKQSMCKIQEQTSIGNNIYSVYEMVKKSVQC